MRTGFQAILCSPEFLFLHEHPGTLDPYALASRLSYFLWQSMPDDELFALAADGRCTGGPGLMPPAPGLAWWVL